MNSVFLDTMWFTQQWIYSLTRAFDTGKSSNYGGLTSDEYYCPTFLGGCDSNWYKSMLSSLLGTNIFYE